MTKEKKEDIEKQEKNSKTSQAAIFLLGIVAGRHGIPLFAHVLYITGIVLTFMWSGGVVKWLMK